MGFCMNLVGGGLEDWLFPRMLASTGPWVALVPLVQALKNKYDQVWIIIQATPNDKVPGWSTHTSTKSSSDSTCGGHVGVAWVGWVVPLEGVGDHRGGRGELGDRVWMPTGPTGVVAPSPGVPRFCFYLTRVQPEIYKNIQRELWFKDGEYVVVMTVLIIIMMLIDYWSADQIDLIMLIDCSSDDQTLMKGSWERVNIENIEYWILR